jgi:hypothetical protein
MHTDSLTKRLAWLSVFTFLTLLTIFFSSHAGDGRTHQQIMEAVGFLIFAAGANSLRCTASSPKNASESRSLWLMPGLLAGALAYAPVVPLEFISDDFTHVVLARESLGHTLQTQFTQGAFHTFFRPLGFVSFCLDYRVWNTWPPGWHLTSLALHIACTASVFYLCCELGCDTEFSGVTALIFALLPVNVEAVAWIAARFDLLASLLMLWTLIFYLRARGRRLWLNYTLALGCFAVALTSKESAYVLPFAIIGLELLFVAQRRYWAVVPFVVLALLALLYRIKILGSLGGYPTIPGSPGSISLGLRSLTGLLVRSPSELLFAINWQQPRVRFGYFLASATAALLLPLCSLRPTTRRSLLFLALLWCLFGALPAQSMLMIAPSLTNTRVLYFSSTGAALLITLLLSRIPAVNVRRGWTAVLLICLFATTEHNTAAWSHAATITQDFLTELRRDFPDPTADTAFVVRNMPRWTEGGVYLLLHRSLEDAVCLAYGNNDLVAIRSDEPLPAGAYHVITLYWIGDWRGRSRPLINTTSPHP